MSKTNELTYQDYLEARKTLHARYLSGELSIADLYTEEATVALMYRKQQTQK